MASEFDALSTESIKELLDKALEQSTFDLNEDLTYVNDYVKKLKKVYNSRVPEDKRYFDFVENQYVKDAQKIQKEIPAWARTKGTTVNLNPEASEVSSAALGWVARRQEDEKLSPKHLQVNLRESSPTLNTVLHELAHTRQNVMGGLPNVRGGSIPAGAIGDTQYRNISQLISNRVPESFGANWETTDRELFANIEAEMIEAMKRGVPFYETPLGKQLEAERNSERLRYIYGRTLQGIPSMQEAPEPTLTEKIKSFLDRYR